MWSALGPGLLMAGAAIGVSHLVQATQAGARYGLELLWLVIAVNVLKMPFFEIGHRFAAVTGRNLLQAYRELGWGWLLLFLILNLVSAVGATAGVTLVLGGLATVVFEMGHPSVWAAFFLVVCVVLLLWGHYQLLDRLIKWVMAVLFLATVLAVMVAVIHGPSGDWTQESLSAWDGASVGFLLALMGWMPAPIELSVWQSLWMEAKNRQRGQPLTIQEAGMDFHLGYWMTTVTACLFLMLGAWVMFGTGAVFSGGSVVFCDQLIDLYRKTLGMAAGWVVGVAALATMFSTVITVVDAYPRSLTVGAALLLGLDQPTRVWSAAGMIGVALVAWTILHFFGANMQTLIGWVTVISFLAAPVFAFLNMMVGWGKLMPAAHRPGIVLRVWAGMGWVFLIGFSLWWAVVQWLGDGNR